MCMVKLALMLMLVGGEQRMSEAGSQIRAEVHMLLVGDPGTGKLSPYCCKQPCQAAGNELCLSGCIYLHAEVK